jgi:hypothetical protein
MIPKNGYRFSKKIMLQEQASRMLHLIRAAGSTSIRSAGPAYVRIATAR